MNGKTSLILLSFALLLAFHISTPLLAADKPVILVGNFVNETGEAKWDTVGSALAGSMAVKLGHVKSIRVVSEESRRRVMAEQRFGQSGFVDTTTAAEVGRLAGATHIVYGTYTLVGDDLMAFAYLVDCTTAVQEGSWQSSRNRNSTAALINEIAELMLAELGAEVTTPEINRIEKEDVGKTIDTLALRGEVEAILYEEGVMRRNITRDDLLRAKDLCEKILAVEPENVYTLNALGSIWGSNRGLGDDDKSIHYHENALSLDPDIAVVHYNLGIALYNKSDVEGAIREYREALRLDPDDALAHTSLGVALYDKGDLEGAIREYYEAVRLNPDLSEARTNLGNALVAKGDLEGAIREQREALRLDPDNIAAHNNLGVALFNKGDLNGAIREYREALRLDPDYAPAHYNLGGALYFKGDLEGAIREFREALKLDPDLADAHYNLGRALYKKGDLDGAIREFREALRLDPDLAPAHNGLGLALSDKGDIEGAIAEYHEALRLDPDLAGAHIGLAVALWLAEEYEEAWEHVRIALELGSSVHPDFIKLLEESSGYNPL